jgi:hypothetical protein
MAPSKSLLYMKISNDPNLNKQTKKVRALPKIITLPPNLKAGFFFVIDGYGSIGVVHGRIHTAAHNAVEYLTHLPFQRLMAVQTAASSAAASRTSASLSPESRMGAASIASASLCADFSSAWISLSRPAEWRLSLRFPSSARRSCRARRGGAQGKAARGGAVRARDGGYERRGGGRSPWRRRARQGPRRAREAGPAGLELARRGPGAGDAPEEGAEVGGAGAGDRGAGRRRAAEGAVAVAGEVGERLARAAELTLVDLLPRRGRRDGGEALPAAHLVDAVERPDGALVELGDEPLRGGRRRACATTTRNSSWHRTNAADSTVSLNLACLGLVWFEFPF